MKLFISMGLLLTSISSVQADQKLENHNCKACHPKIYQEYQNSYHANSSIYKDKLFKTIWEKHPASKKNNFKCAICHTPSDHDLIDKKTKLSKNNIQLKEPISCQYCHKIETIEKHAKMNKNLLNTKNKTFFSADAEKKGTKLEFKEQSSFFGLITKKIGSPYHDIDYSNENFYNGNVCLGCHSHKQNSHGFTICDLEVKEGDSKDTCISCHMPKVKGTLANQKSSKTHSFHSATALVSNPDKLSKYINITTKKSDNGFSIIIQNKANHTLVPHPLRLAQLRVTIKRDNNSIKLKPKNFMRVIGTDAKPSFPWLATEVIKDTTIKAFEKREIKFDKEIKPGDTVSVKFGYYKINPKIAQKLNVTDKSLLNFITLTEKNFTF